jgi:hypothetical protein
MTENMPREFSRLMESQPMKVKYIHHSAFDCCSFGIIKIYMRGVEFILGTDYRFTRKINSLIDVSVWHWKLSNSIFIPQKPKIPKNLHGQMKVHSDRHSCCHVRNKEEEEKTTQTTEMSITLYFGLRLLVHEVHG